MSAPKLRFTVRGLMIAVAVAGLCLGLFVFAGRCRRIAQAETIRGLALAWPVAPTPDGPRPDGVTYRNFRMPSGVHTLFYITSKAQQHLDRAQWYDDLAAFGRSFALIPPYLAFWPVMWRRWNVWRAARHGAS